ncbi:hypothetical protein HDV00_004165 [Rhizophlyctis rosea]|nr:hypothetical protein HDV00_004165 [Rhizophlyctis rosea]
MNKRKAASGKFYAVRTGRNPGVYNSWDACKAQTERFPGAIFKSFPTHAEAFAFISSAAQQPAPSSSGPSPPPPKRKRTSPPPRKTLTSSDTDETFGDESDVAACLQAVDGLPDDSPATTTVLLKQPTSSASSTQLPPLDVYTDGSCLGNGQKGARAGLGIWYGADDERNIFERLPGRVQTNNRAEVLAAIRAIQTAPPDHFLTIHSDSKYMRDGITKWMAGWKKNGWKTAAGKDVVNQDLWRRLDKLRNSYKGQLAFKYVRAHVGIPGNEGADYLANRGADLSPVPSPPPSP